MGGTWEGNEREVESVRHARLCYPREGIRGYRRRAGDAKPPAKNQGAAVQS